MERELKPLALSVLRERRGISQIHLGIICGVSQSMVSLWENGYQIPLRPVLTKLGHLFDTADPSDLLLPYDDYREKIASE